MSGSVAFQAHAWPWSFNVQKESVNCGDELPWYSGSPVISVTEGNTLSLDSRHEDFQAFGAPFLTQYGPMQLFQAPHGLLAPFGNTLPDAVCRLHVRTSQRKSEYIAFHRSPKALPSVHQTTEENQEDTSLSRTVLAWANALDGLLEKGGESGLPWQEALDYLEGLGEERKEPRMALIVKIAEDLGSSLEETVQGARRLLARERRLLPAGRLDEVDRACLQWYIRQPGSDGAQKAAANRQRLLGVSRQETFDTLENRVLKDFMHRTAQEGRRYLLFDCEPGQRHSKRAKKVGSFRTLCDALAKLPHLASVPFQRGMPQPNYVLQNDPRYKKIWKWYIRLLKQEDEADSLWTWQNRTWDDIAALLLQAATVRLARNTRGNIVLEPLGNATLRLLREQRLGRRLEAGSEPGPFLVRLGNAPFETGHIMEFVHSSQLNEHPAFRQFQEETHGKTAAIQPLARLGAAHFVLLSPLDPRGGGTTLIPVWGVHTAASSDRFSFTEIAASASRALEAHDNAIYGRAQTPPHVHGLALCSTLDERIARADEENIHAAMLGAAPETWKTNLDLLETLLEDLLKGLL